MKRLLLSNLILISIVTATTLKVPSQYSTIQAGIDAASDGDTVSVSAGTYMENIDFKGKNLVVLGENKETTIIDGNATASVVTMKSLDSTATLSNFTLINGIGVGAWTGSALQIVSCTQTSIQDIIIIDNQSNGNTVSMSSSDGVILSNSKISGNSADNNHFWIEGGNVILMNLLITKNSGSSGAIIKVHGTNTQLELWNSTITNNNLPPIQSDWAPITVKVKNTIFWGNSSDSLEFGTKLGNSIDISFSLHPGGHSGSNNIYKNPQFVKVITTGDEESDYHLQDWSPAISAGTASGAPTTDIEGNPRPNPVGSNPDMGAYENPSGASSGSVDEPMLIPESFALHANYPNPFNPFTTITYDLPRRSQVTLGIYDLLGKRIKTLLNQSQDVGVKTVRWDGTDEFGRQVSAGVYLYQIKAGEFTQTRKMLLLK